MKKNLILLSFIAFGGMLVAQNQTINGFLTINPGSNNSYTQGIRIKEAADKWSLVMLGAGSSTSMGTNEDGWIMGRSSTLNFVISRNSADGLNGMVINKSGDVGFGVAKPTSKLDVNGTIRAKEVIIGNQVSSTGY